MVCAAIVPLLAAMSAQVIASIVGVMRGEMTSLSEVARGMESNGRQKIRSAVCGC